MSDMQSTIEEAFERRADITPRNVETHVKEATQEAIDMLDRGTARVAEKKDGEWVVNDWLKKAVLLSFRIEDNAFIKGGFTNYYDKVASKYADTILKEIKKTKVGLSGKILLSVTKGIDTTKLLRMSEIIIKELGHSVNIAVLSGPTIAIEVAKGLPSTAVVAAHQLKIAKEVQTVFNSEHFRVYTNTDVTGVELGGSIKNIIAIACGVCDGLGFGSNTKAAILTRGLAEMARLGKALGAKQRTFSGLTGLGDLVTTCVSPRSRNRSVGEKLGQGKSIKTIMSKMEMVAEGVETVKAVYQLSQKHKISMPITTEVYNIIYKRKKPSQAVSDLMNRKTKSE